MKQLFHLSREFVRGARDRKVLTFNNYNVLSFRIESKNVNVTEVCETELPNLFNSLLHISTNVTSDNIGNLTVENSTSLISLFADKLPHCISIGLQPSAEAKHKEVLARRVDVAISPKYLRLCPRLPQQQWPSHIRESTVESPRIYVGLVEFGWGLYV